MMDARMIWICGLLVVALWPSSVKGSVALSCARAFTSSQRISLQTSHVLLSRRETPFCALVIAGSNASWTACAVACKGLLPACYFLAAHHPLSLRSNGERNARWRCLLQHVSGSSQYVAFSPLIAFSWLHHWRVNEPCFGAGCDSWQVGILAMYCLLATNRFSHARAKHAMATFNAAGKCPLAVCCPLVAYNLSLRWERNAP